MTRKYIPNQNLCIDGRNIPYPVFTACGYLTEHDHIEDVGEFCDSHEELVELLNQIIALKQSCFLLLHTSHSCGSLSDSLYDLKLRLIQELQEKCNYSFDDDWMESFVPID